MESLGPSAAPPSGGRTSLDNSDYQVGWICALSFEMTAARAMLDEKHEPPHEQDPSDHNNYCLGRIKRHNIVIACLPGCGTTSAAVVAQQMLYTFKEIRFGLMVGIGGGVPSLRHDIRLGDIVVSKPEGKFGGVVQYDFGKIRQNGKFEPIGSLDQPPQSLLTARSTLESNHQLGDNDIPKFLSEMYIKHPNMSIEFVCPGAENDRLFREDYEHPDMSTNCEACEASQLIDRPPRKPDIPQVHYGLIASGNQVIKHGLTRSKYGRDLGVLCFEMEAAGLMNHFKCLVIRGICDYSDSHKNNRWQSYAAATAAAYAKELIRVIPTHAVQLEKRIIPVSDIKLQKVGSEILISINKQDQNAQHRECHRLFNTSEYEKHKNRNPDRVEGTCQWVLTHPQYKSWLIDKRDNLLWISADPGCGKSVLSKSLIDKELQGNGSRSTCYFFFKDNEEQNSLSTALCALLHQLFSRRPHLLRHAIPYWIRDGEKLQKQTIRLWQVLLSAATDPEAGDVVFILDALDECANDGRQDLLKFLVKFLESTISQTFKSSTLKFLVTSRPYDNIERPFRGWPTIRLAGEEENEKIMAEIDLVISDWISQLSTELDLLPSLQESLRTRLQQIKQRTYLWLYLVIEEVRKSLKRTEKKFNSIIDNIPESVDAAYEAILCKSTDQAEGKMLYSIIVASTRPLTLNEMDVAFALTMEKNTSSYGELDLDGHNLKRRIRNLCGLFVYVHDSRVHLLHQTAKDFLVKRDLSPGKKSNLWRQSLDEQNCERVMAEACMRYLLLDDLKTPLSEGEPAYTLMNYSAVSWPEHFRKANVDQEDILSSLSLTLWKTNSSLYVMWSSIYFKIEERYSSDPKWTGLHFATYCGHTEVVRYLLNHKTFRVNLTDDKNQTALSVAAERGYNIVVQLLLDQGADVNAQGGYYGNALQAASFRGHEKVVQLLLGQGTNVNAQGGIYGNALQAASYEGHEKVVQLLIDQGVDVNAQEGFYGNALQVASSRGYEKLVQLLLDQGADVNAKGGHYGNALQAASSEGHEKLVQLLLDQGADVNAQGGRYGNALQVASSRGYEKLMQLLLDKGAEVNAQGGHYGNALQAALYGGHEKLVQLLLDQGANVNAKGGHYGNALQAASSRGYEKLMQLLLDQGAEVNAQGGNYGNALQAASYGGHEKLMLQLLDQGAEVNAQGGIYGNALQAASYGGYEKLVQLLLDQGAEVNAQGGHYGNALQAASYGGHEKLVQLLLDQGANVNAKGGHYGNALQAASSRGYEKLMQLLLDQGAEVNAQGGNYGNALQAASYGGHEKLVQLLLDQGAEVNAQGGNYGNALQAASYGGYEKLMLQLLDQGAEVNAQGGIYGNALQAASYGGYEKLVQLLLDQGAEVNAQGGNYDNALQAALFEGHEKLVQLLLDQGADVNAQGRLYGNALQAASSRGYEKVVQLLIDQGVDVNAQEGFYGNALQVASSRGYEKLVQLLLDQGADVNAKGGHYGNALQAASSEGHEKLVQLLLDQGVDLNAKGGYYGNALQAASYGGHEKLVQLLLDQGANVNAKGGHYGNALQAASYEGHEKVVQQLLDQGADVKAQGGEFGNALQAASSIGHKKLVQLLVDQGADVNVQGGLYVNALQAASFGGYENIVQLLQDRGAEVNAQGGGQLCSHPSQ